MAAHHPILPFPRSRCHPPFPRFRPRQRYQQCRRFRYLPRPPSLPNSHRQRRRFRYLPRQSCRLCFRRQRRRFRYLPRQSCRPWRFRQRPFRLNQQSHWFHRLPWYRHWRFPRCRSCCRPLRHRPLRHPRCPRCCSVSYQHCQQSVANRRRESRRRLAPCHPSQLRRPKQQSSSPRSQQFQRCRHCRHCQRSCFQQRQR
jgi:hypothetical protein